MPATWPSDEVSGVSSGGAGESHTQPGSSPSASRIPARPPSCTTASPPSRINGRPVGQERGEHGATDPADLIGQGHHVAHAHARGRGLPGRLEPRHVAEILRLHSELGQEPGQPLVAQAARLAGLVGPGRAQRRGRAQKDGHGPAVSGPWRSRSRGSPQAGQATSASCWRGGTSLPQPGHRSATAAVAPQAWHSYSPAPRSTLVNQPQAGQRARAGMAQRRPSASSQRPKTRLALCPPKPKPFDRP